MLAEIRGPMLYPAFRFCCDDGDFEDKIVANKSTATYFLDAAFAALPGQHFDGAARHFGAI